MGLTISRLLQSLAPSATLAMAAKARELKAAGRTIHDFSLGEPDFDTPAPIGAAARRAIESGKTRYTPAAGIPELRAAVAKSYQAAHGVPCTPAQVVVSNGAKHALHNALTALCDPGDEVIIPAPYWVSYADLVRLAGGVPVIIPTLESNDFLLTPDELQRALTPRSKLLLLCSPSNPTGSVYTAEQLHALADVCAARDLGVISDEIYEHLIYGDRKFTSFPTVCADMIPRTVVVAGVSKSYAMTGWRIGWTIAPAPISEAIANLQSQETSNPSSISQYAALEAVQGDQSCIGRMLEVFSRRRDYVRSRLSALPGVRLTSMAGAFYAFFGIQAHLGKTYAGKRIDDSTAWCLELLASEGVATVAGAAFGAEGYVRLSYATSDETLAAGLDAIERFLASAR
jgi:aspartate aminotransferase